MVMNREKFTQGKRWVVKVGSSLVTNDGLGLDRIAIADWARQLVRLKAAGMQLVLVSSGAVAEGVSRLGLTERPREIHLQQAAAAVGCGGAGGATGHSPPLVGDVGAAAPGGGCTAEGRAPD